MQWDLIRVGRCYVISDGPRGCILSGIPCKVLAKSPPFILVEWMDDGTTYSLDHRIMTFSHVDKAYLREYKKIRSKVQIVQPQRCVTCGTLMDVTASGDWRCPQCGASLETA